MCGILGWLGDIAPSDHARFGGALDSIAHRGPDDQGVFAGPNILLGHRRLAILDLSLAGHQPMVEPETGAVLTYNGEIYNYLELRAELEIKGHRFRSASDSEVLLRGLIEWGYAVLSRLNGMFAFAFWDPRERRLLVARDRFGVKPLYYRLGPEGFAFASEPKALLSLFPVHRQVAEGVLQQFLGNNLLYANGESFYQGIHLLEPAHFGVYGHGDRQLKTREYWTYPVGTPVEIDPATAVEEFDALFTDAVRLRFRSDVPVGLTLSGGLDSTGILAAANRISDRPLVSFTSVYSETERGELNWAKAATEGGKSSLVAVAAPPDRWLETMQKITWHMDAPGYSPAVYPLWFLMQRARNDKVIVLLEGQGADEALAGYPQYAALALIDSWSKNASMGNKLRESQERLGGLADTFTWRWTLAWLARELSPSALRWHRGRTGMSSLLRPGVTIPADVAPEHEARDRVTQRLLQDHSRNILPGLLHYGDAISMAHGIESRHPFMDYRLVEWMFRMPTAIRSRATETKWVLREYLRKHGQQRIGDRKDKKGYPTPVASWLTGEQARQVEDILLNRQSLLHDWIDPAKVRALLDRNKHGSLTASHHLYKLLSTQMWLDRCIDGATP
jgi:asparagine synthase (glutamine-hydrolysing)